MDYWKIPIKTRSVQDIEQLEDVIKNDLRSTVYLLQPSKDVSSLTDEEIASYDPHAEADAHLPEWNVAFVNTQDTYSKRNPLRKFARNYRSEVLLKADEKNITDILDMIADHPQFYIPTDHVTRVRSGVLIKEFDMDVMDATIPVTAQGFSQVARDYQRELNPQFFIPAQVNGQLQTLDMKLHYRGSGEASAEGFYRGRRENEELTLFAQGPISNVLYVNDVADATIAQNARAVRTRLKY